MGTETGDIKHEEIWDDSALIDSWNEALEEYKVSRRVLQLSHRRGRNLVLRHKLDLPSTADTLHVQKYHSIHARGGTVDDIPDLPES